METAICLVVMFAAVALIPYCMAKGIDALFRGWAKTLQGA
jgi:hypothetical protein